METGSELPAVPGSAPQPLLAAGAVEASAGSKLRIQVFYPLESGRIVLRTEEDWNLDLEPYEVSRDGTVSRFRVALERPYVYFKPLLVEGDRHIWSRGPNSLAIRETPAGVNVYPHFRSPKEGRISELLRIPESNLADAHGVRIYHPPGYFENTLKYYPVIYMQDGKNLFFPAEAFLGSDWKIDRTLHLLDEMNLIDQVIVVGVYSNRREVEYTHPGYEAYGHYLVSELKPAVEARLRTLPGRQNTAVMGSSLGGLVALYLAWQWPEVFGKAACMSSTFSLSGPLSERIASEPKRDIEIYLDSGWPRDNYEVTLIMRDLLARRGYEFGTELLHFAFPHAAHSERDWAMRCHIPLQFFFGQAPNFTVPRRDQGFVA